MARIKIIDLPKEKKITKEEMRKVLGGTLVEPTTFPTNRTFLKTGSFSYTSKYFVNPDNGGGILFRR